jgi:hypothetical protein
VTRTPSSGASAGRRCWRRTSPAAPVGRAGQVVGRGLGLFGVGRHGLDGVPQAGEAAEQAGKLRIDPRQDLAVPGDQLVARRAEEAVVGTEERAELGEPAVEAHAVDQLAHGPADALDLGQPDVVDLAGRQVGRGVHADLVGVALLAVGQVVARRGRPAARDVRVGDVGEEAFEGGHDLVPVDVCRFGRVGHADEQRAVDRVVDELVAHLLRDVTHADLRRRDAFVPAALHQLHLLVDQRGQGAQAGQVVVAVVVGGRGHGGEDHGRVLVGALELVERLQLVVEGHGVEAAGQVVLEQVPRQAVGVVEPVAVDGVQRGALALEVLDAPADRVG